MLPVWIVLLCCIVVQATIIQAKLTGEIHVTNNRLLQSVCCSNIQTHNATYQTSGSTTQTLPFKIHGPKRLNDKIAVIGAGTSGIHMALLLKEKGFTNVRILEKTNELGGKLKTVNHRGAPQELGAVYVASNYEHVLKLIKKYAPEDLLNFIPSSVWLDGFPGPISFQNYVGGFLFKLLNTNSSAVAAQAIFADICRYNTLHRLLLGDYNEEIMPEPPSKVYHINFIKVCILLRIID